MCEETIACTPVKISFAAVQTSQVGVILFMINTREAGGCLLPFNVSTPVAIWALPVHGKIQALFSSHREEKGQSKTN